MKIAIRAHHLLCTSLFEGHGYSEGFTAGLEKTVRQLHNGENHEVILLDKPDRICACCPKLVSLTAEDPLAWQRASETRVPWTNTTESRFASSEEGCKSPGNTLLGCADEHNHVAVTDRKVLDALGIEAGKAYSYSELLDIVRKCLTEKNFNDICGHCGWNDGGYCSYQKLLQRIAELRAALR